MDELKDAQSFGPRSRRRKVTRGLNRVAFPEKGGR
jgi:hypothetical protein